MDDQELHTLLEKLHAEIERTHTVDKKAQQLLGDLEGDIAGLIRRSGGEPPQTSPDLRDRLEESIAYLEVSHPTLTGMLSKLLATLSNTGI